MPDSSKQTIRKVRTFAEDVARAQGAPVPAQNREDVTLPPSLKSEIEREMRASTPTPVAQPLDIDRKTATAQAEIEAAAFDIRSEAKDASPEGTIINDRRAERWSFSREFKRGMQGWMAQFKNALGQRPTAVMAPDIAPQAEGTYPEAPAPKKGVRRISEPREHVPLAHTTKEEARAYREELNALPSREVAPAQTPFKEARPMRTPQEDPSARERLEALARTQAEAPRASRDIPFIPPEYSRPESSPVRTYRTDALTDIKERELSKTEIASEEMLRRGSMRAPIVIVAPRSRMVPILIAVGVILILGIGGTIAYPYLRGTTQTEVASTPGFFTTESTQAVPLPQDRTTLLATLTSLLEETAVGNRQFAQWYFTYLQNGVETTAGSAEFMRILDPRAPGVFIRSLAPNMMIGSVGTEHAPFIILKPTNFEAGLAGMLAWEESMSIDLSPFFGDPVRRSYDADALTVDQTREARFRDHIIQNTDVRLLVDEQGLERILYSFPDPETLIITSSSAAFEAILSELR